MVAEPLDMVVSRREAGGRDGGAAMARDLEEEGCSERERENEGEREGKWGGLGAAI